jgi:microcompartment protein CcmL/EutN
MLFNMAGDSVCLSPMSVLSLGLIETRGLVAAIEAADAAAKAANVTLLSAELLGGGIVTLRIQGDLGAVQAAVEAGAQAAKRIGEVVAVRVIPRPVAELAALSPLKSRLHVIENSDAVRVSKVTPKQESRAPIGARTKLAEKPKATISPTPSRTRTIRAGARVPDRPAPTEHPADIQANSPTQQYPAPATLSPRRPNFAELEAMPVARLRQYARNVKNLSIQGRQISMANKTQLLDAIREAATLD